MGKSNKQKTAQKAPSPAPSKRKAPVLPVIVAIIAVFVVIFLVANASSNKVEFVNGQVSRTMATVDECQATTLPLAIPAGETPETVAEAVFDALSRTAGVGLVTVYEAGPSVHINYCQSYTSEPALRELIAPTGFLAQ